MHQNQPPSHFGAEVAARIKAAGLTYDDVCEGARIPKATLSRRLNDPTPSFNVGELHRIAALLGTTAGAILSDIENAA
jgi:transcriptional regulator with XRE-family HTH domain